MSPANNRTPGQPELKPLYLQIQEMLIQRVVDGEWGPGEMLPSEMRLASEYNVHQGTVRKALDAMALRNLLVRQQGKGTFVATVSMRHNPFRYFRLVLRSNPAERPVSHFISIEVAAATEAERTALQLASPDDRVVRATKIRAFGTGPAIIEENAYPHDMFPGLDELFRKLHPDTTYGLLEQKYRVLITTVQEKLDAAAASRLDAEHLKVDLGAPLLRIDRTAFALDGRPAEWRVSRCTNACEYIIDQM
jgi:GntR family transcriptional regulator